jgi:hypothetical protein
MPPTSTKAVEIDRNKLAAAALPFPSEVLLEGSNGNGTLVASDRTSTINELPVEKGSDGC